MDSIDIIDPHFSLNMPESLNIPESLNVPDINEIIINNQMDSQITGGGFMKPDYTILIYIASAIFLGLIFMVIYKKYINVKNKKNINENYLEGCPAGFCTINQNKIN
jgi:hypothetical protein